MFKKFNGKSLLFIGPGISKECIELDRAKEKVDYVACLNDGVLYHKCDLYFVAEKFIFNYVKSKVRDRLNDSLIVFLGLHKKHKLRIDKSFFKKNKPKFKSILFAESISNLKKNELKYYLPLCGEFSDKNMNVLSNLLHCFPKGEFKYIRARTLANALQVIYNFEFKKVYLIGFMDSLKFKRSDNSHQQKYVKIAKGIRSNLRPPEERSEDELKNSFDYQCQVLVTINCVYNKNNKFIYNLCPKDKSPQHYLEYVSL